MNNWKMLRSCFLLLCVVIFDQILEVAGQSTSFPVISKGMHHFKIDPTPDFAPARLAPGWIDSSSVSCGISCMQHYADCLSFLYNRTTHLCSPASSVFNKSDPPTSKEGELHYKVTCDYSKGFRLMFSGSAMACLANYQVVWLNYTQAHEACQAKGAVLASVKTFDKLAILRNLVGGNMAWVGADDLAGQGYLVWKLDSSPVANETLESVFSPGEPNNALGLEHCVQYYYVNRMLNDDQCSIRYGYVCEMPLPFYDNIF
ncbi:unnamed protein product [Lymnaea stagnalis]|uniref:C-type lectin domain-containing protein n=1 Tax=Lymnaea stagnalis TaxID=6523 RepID=A0AAV2IME7_LYMST